jgi:hypothetical protein
MNRQIVYSGAIPLDTDQLSQNKNTMVGLGFLMQAILGTTTVADGLACTPTSPASMSVLVAQGSIYEVENIDNSAFGSLAADTVNQIVKQGIIVGNTTFNCPAPGTTGFSTAYLIQASYQDVDGGAVVLPYYNASNPAVAFNGPNNTGVSQNTVRQGVCVLTLKAGTPATTGTQVLPGADAGAISIAAITVANGQTTITSGNIFQITQSAITTKLTGVLAAIQSGASTYAQDVSGSANTIAIALNPPITSYAAGQPYVFKAAHTTTNSSPVINVCQLGNIALVDPAGNPVMPGKIKANGIYLAINNGTAAVVLNLPPDMVGGGFKNLKIVTTSASAGTITADELVLEDASGNATKLSSVNVSYSAGTAGANGLDTGVIATSTGYNEWVIYNPTTNTVAALLSLSATAPTMPSGYTFKARVGWSFYASSTFRFKIQYGKEAQYVVGTSPASPPVLATGSSGSVTTPTYTAVSVTGFVPPTASKIRVGLVVSGSGTLHAIAAPNPNYPSGFWFLALTNNAVSGSVANITADMVLESGSVYYAADGTLAALVCYGWTDNL